MLNDDWYITYHVTKLYPSSDDADIAIKILRRYNLVKRQTAKPSVQEAPILKHMRLHHSLDLLNSIVNSIENSIGIFIHYGVSNTSL